MSLEFHEAANIFPLDDENLSDLAKDIRAHGQQVPIELLNGKIIDGRRRYKACQLIGVEPKTRKVSPSDPVAYVLSLNLHRRQLSPSQRAMVGAKAREFYDRQAKERMSAGGGDKKSKAAKSGVVNVSPPIVEPTKSRDAAGKVVNVSGTLIDRAREVIEKTVPEVAKAVEEGRLSVTKGADLVGEPEEVQRRVASEATASGSRQRPPKEVPAEGQPDPDNNPEDRKSRGKGIAIANEAINCLIRIPKDDGLRLQGFKLVTDWIKRNK